MLEISESLTLGLPLVMNLSVLILAISGSLLGLFIGAIPGLSATMAVAILIPLTYSMNPQQAFALLLTTLLAQGHRLICDDDAGTIHQGQAAQSSAAQEPGGQR